MGPGCCAATANACHMCTDRFWSIKCCGEVKCAFRQDGNLFNKWVRVNVPVGQTPTLWWILYDGQEKLAEVELVRSLSDMTAVYMAGGAHELLQDNSCDFLDNILRVGLLFHPISDRWLWDIAALLRCELPKILMEYLHTHGGTASFIAVAVNSVSRMYQTRVMCGSDYVSAMESAEEDENIAEKYLNHMHDRGLLESDRADREMWEKSSPMGRDVCFGVASQLGQVPPCSGFRRVRYISHEESERQEHIRRVAAMRSYIRQHGNEL